MTLRELLNSTTKQLFRIDEVSNGIEMHINTIRNWTDTGKLPFVRTPGGHRRFSRTTMVRLGASLNIYP